MKYTDGFMKVQARREGAELVVRGEMTRPSTREGVLPEYALVKKYHHNGGAVRELPLGLPGKGGVTFLSGERVMGNLEVASNGSQDYIKTMLIAEDAREGIDRVREGLRGLLVPERLNEWHHSDNPELWIGRESRLSHRIGGVYWLHKHLPSQMRETVLDLMPLVIELDTQTPTGPQALTHAQHLRARYNKRWLRPGYASEGVFNGFPRQMNRERLRDWIDCGNRVIFRTDGITWGVGPDLEVLVHSSQTMDTIARIAQGLKTITDNEFYRYSEGIDYRD